MLKKIAVFLVTGLCLCQGLFANDVLETYFDSDELDRRIRSYIDNVSNLIPDSTTLQNVWPFTGAGAKSFWFGAGLNGSFTFLDKKKVGSLIDSSEGFGGNHYDLSQFPEAIPFLPGVAIDVRGGKGGADFGLTGMWLDDEILKTQAGVSFLGDGGKFSYRSFGMDARYTILNGGVLDVFSFYKLKLPSSVARYVPDVTLQAGYYFTWIGFGIEAGGTEKVKVDFRDDSYLFSLQVAKAFGGLTPYLGMKLISSKTDSEFTWETDRPVMLREELYRDGARYQSAGVLGEALTYFQLYGGVGIAYLSPYLFNVGIAVNPATGHFAVNFGAKYVLGI